MTAGMARRKGRPPKSDKGPATMSLAMRVRPEVYEEIRQDAEKSGRSISAQAEMRVLHREPGADDLSRLISMVIDEVERRAGNRKWAADEEVRRQCRVAADFALTVLLGELPKGKYNQTLSAVNNILGEHLVSDQTDEKLFDSVMSES